MRVVLDSDQWCFGGQGRIDHNVSVHPHKISEGKFGWPDYYRVQVYVPSRTAIVLAPEGDRGLAAQPIVLDLTAVAKSNQGRGLLLRYRPGHQHPSHPFDKEREFSVEAPVLEFGYLESIEFILVDAESGEAVLFPRGRFNQSFEIFLPGHYVVASDGDLTVEPAYSMWPCWKHFTYPPSGDVKTQPPQLERDLTVPTPSGGRVQ
jgi:hypothetical protein